MSLLEIKDLSYTADSQHASRILDGLSFTVDTGEVHALLGTNGTGKSTLAYLIMGCDGYRPSMGEILFEGKPLADMKIHERALLGITMAWQEPVRFEGLTVNDYLSIRNKDADTNGLLSLVGLNPEHYSLRMVDRTLSGGERKRIELASILALGTKLAILDEPDSGIDMLSTNDIINVITAFKRRGSAVLLITHREEIAIIADRSSQLCNGRIICSGVPAKVADHYKSKQCLTCKSMECHYV